ncbi:hypothetical protein GALMADRAFT_231393 [Galerina marginata CBS 339.88]|uniref:Uncharacterized protein n=1 Tax=Galerina marginata (strain CBS 339.88) TaxID=685588 RepID=A0A067SC20_GALM3|nr:hypothetical protein GALMADRAFT_231393 [Galerina marginata CBS 339.88]
MELTANNVQSVLGVYAERLYTVLPQVFELLVDPDLEEMALYHYVVAIQERLSKDSDSRPDGHLGFDSFGEAAFEGGIVKAMMKITQDPRTDKWHGLASYFAMDAMWQLTRTGNVEERRALLQELLEHNVLKICMDKIENHPLVIHRQVACCLIRCLCAESYLGEIISSSQAADLIMVLCKHILEGPELYEKQFFNAQLTWQSFLSFGKFGAPREKAHKYAPRYYAMSQENAAWAIQGLLLRCPPADQQLCYNILNHNPEVLDLLFKCASIPRPPWYPELAIDSIVSEGIIMFFRVPRNKIPGIEVNLDHESQKEADTQWKAVLASCKLLTSRPNWVGLLLGVWDMIADEKWQDLKRMLGEVVSKYHAQRGYTIETFLAIFEYRGSCRICIERLIATLSHSGNEANVSDGDLLSLLRVGSAASRPVKTNMDQLNSQVEQFEYIETAFELFRKPLSAVFTEEEVEPPLQVADEPVMGPTAFARVLTLLAQRGVLQKIPKMTKLPQGVAARTNLSKLKEIASPEGIRRFLIVARKRVTARREAGHKRIRKDNEMDYACIAYFTAAELAAALIAFDVATEGNYSQQLAGVRRELVLCLGNGAEMALGLQHYDRASYLATASVEAANDLPNDNSLDAVDETIRAKNHRRVERARAGSQP